MIIMDIRSIRNLERSLKAIANRRRLCVLQLLSRRAMSVIELSAELRLSFRSTSKHLQVLTQGGFVESEQIGRSMYYKLSNDLSSKHRKLLALLS